mmetsp:Transcript_110690/g.344936  ORF Transcript_110690/g.344936 Transcript_110690/m.344936 type:complete len:645 (+) Transcript_110690:388-2322(+)
MQRVRVPPVRPGRHGHLPPVQRGCHPQQWHLRGPVKKHLDWCFYDCRGLAPPHHWLRGKLAVPPGREPDRRGARPAVPGEVQAPRGESTRAANPRCHAAVPCAASLIKLTPRKWRRITAALGPPCEQAAVAAQREPPAGGRCRRGLGALLQLPDGRDPVGGNDSCGLVDTRPLHQHGLADAGPAQRQETARLLHHSAMGPQEPADPVEDQGGLLVWCLRVQLLGGLVPESAFSKDPGGHGRHQHYHEGLCGDMQRHPSVAGQREVGGSLEGAARGGYGSAPRRGINLLGLSRHARSAYGGAPEEPTRIRQILRQKSVCNGEFAQVVELRTDRWRRPSPSRCVLLRRAVPVAAQAGGLAAVLAHGAPRQPAGRRARRARLPEELPDGLRGLPDRGRPERGAGGAGGPAGLRLRGEQGGPRGHRLRARVGVARERQPRMAVQALPPGRGHRGHHPRAADMDRRLLLALCQIHAHVYINKGCSAWHHLLVHLLAHGYHRESDHVLCVPRGGHPSGLQSQSAVGDLLHSAVFGGRFVQCHCGLGRCIPVGIPADGERRSEDLRRPAAQGGRGREGDLRLVRHAEGLGRTVVPVLLPVDVLVALHHRTGHAVHPAIAVDDLLGEAARRAHALPGRGPLPCRVHGPWPLR